MYVIINGVSSDSIQGLQVLSLPPITKPKMRRQADTIDGRAGDIITELGYEAYDRTITVLLHHTYDLDAITAFFNTSGEIIFSNEPDKKYYFRLLEKIDYERAVQFKTANITFHVQPYKYPANETPLTVSGQNAEITVPNAGNVPSAPTIQLTGSGTVGVYLGNAQTLQVTIPEDGITIDTEAQDATSNGQLANRSVTGDYDSVRLQPGDNDVSFSGDVSAVITKYTRWV